MAKVTIHVDIDSKHIATQVAQIEQLIKNVSGNVTVSANTRTAQEQIRVLISAVSQLQSQMKDAFTNKGDVEAWAKYSSQRIKELEAEVERLGKSVKTSSNETKALTAGIEQIGKGADKAATSVQNLTKQIATLFSTVQQGMSYGQSQILQGLGGIIGSNSTQVQRLALPAGSGSTNTGIMVYPANQYAGTGFVLGGSHGSSVRARAKFPTNNSSDVIYMTGDNNGNYSYIGNQGRPQIMALPSGRDWQHKTHAQLKSELLGSMPDWRNSYGGERGQLKDDIVDWDAYNRNISEATQKTGIFEQVLGTSLGKYFARLGMYQMVSATIYGTVQAFNQALDTMKEVDSELASIQKVTDFSAEQMSVIEKGAYETASKYGVSAQEYLESVSAFAKAGYKDLADDLGELAIKTQLVGDVTASTANQFLLSVDAAWDMKGSVTDLSRVLDEANVVENNYATSIDKLAQGMPNVASVAAMAGMSVEETIAALGTITAATQQSGTKAATALRALILNIMKDTTTEVEEGVTVTKEQVESLDEVLHKYAQSALDAAEKTGDMVNPMEVVAALAKAYRENAITEKDLKTIEMALGGKLRTNQLDALLRHYYGEDGEEGMYEGMMNKMAESAGSADKEIGVMLDTWSAKANILQNTWTEFIAKTISTDFFKGLLDGATKLLNVVGDLGTALEAVGGIFAAKFMFNAPEKFGKVTSFISDIVSQLSTLKDMSTEVGATGFKGFLEVLTSGNATGLVLAGITAAITATVIAVQKYRQSIQEAADASMENAQKSAEETSKVVELYSAYQKATDGSKEQAEASRQLAVALGYEASAVDSLVGKYGQLTAEKIKANVGEAVEAETRTAENLETQYLFERQKKAAVKYVQSYLSKNPEVSNIIHDALSGAAVVREGMWEAADWSDDGIIKYYDAIHTAIEEVQQSARTLGVEQRREIYNSKEYMSLLSAAGFLKPQVDAARESRRNRWKAEEQEILRGDQKWGLLDTQEEFDAYRKNLQDTIKDQELLAAKLEVLDAMFPEFASNVEDATGSLDENADAANKAKNALEAYKNALSSGGEKDDNFQTMSDAFDKMVEAGDKGYFGSNAFQEGAKLLFGADYVQGKSGEDILKHAKELKDVFSEKSMGRGLFDLISNAKGVEKTADGWYKVADGLAAVKKNADGGFDFAITDDPEQLLKVANALEVSATAILSMQQATGVYDPSVDVAALQGLINQIDDLEKKVAEEKKLKFSTNADDVKTEIGGIVSTAESAAKTYYLNFIASYGVGGEGGEGGGEGYGEGHSATGTSSFKGGLTWVNDEKGGFNPELIETGGKSFFVNGGRPALISLPKGAVIHNATETRKLFAQDYLEVPHHYYGTVPSGAGLADRSKKIAGIGGKGSASSGDWWEKLQQYMEDLLEKAGDALDKQLEAIDAELFYLQYGKEVSEKATKLEEARMDLLEAEQELINAQTERTVRYFNAETGQWEWMADQKDILKAQEDLAEKQKDYLQAQYDYLEDVWSELKDDIQKAIDGKKDVNIEKVLKRMMKSKAGGLTGNVEGVIGDLLNLITALSNGTALDSYDSGGIANGLGYMFKATKADEVVLNGKLSNAILSPKRSQQFADFTSSLERMFGMSAMMDKPQSRMGFNTSNTDSHNIIINGMKVGSDMLNKPLSEVLSVLPIYCN